MKKRKFLALMTALSLSITAIIPTAFSISEVKIYAASTEKTLTDVDTIKTIQAMLNYMGYDCGNPDGVAGTNTKNAINEYQNSKGQAQTGQLTASLLADLYSDMLDILEKTSQTYSDVLTSLSTNDSSCTSAPQQAANGAYRAADMLAVITKGLDTNNKYQDDIAGIQLKQIINNATCSSAAQQEVNGLYTCVQLLNIITKEKDPTGVFLSAVSNSMDTFSNNDSSCQGASQQVVNAYYRMTELLAVIAAIDE